MVAEWSSGADGARARLSSQQDPNDAQTDASCDSIPGLHGSPFVRHVRDSSSGRWLAGNVAVQFTTDTLGRVYPMSTLIVSWNDTILERGVIVDSARRAPRYQMSNSPGMRYRCRTSLDGPPAGSEQR
jgi:hypothetical protein